MSPSRARSDAKSKFFCFQTFYQQVTQLHEPSMPTRVPSPHKPQQRAPVPAAASQWFTVLSARGLWAAQDCHPSPPTPGVTHEPRLLAASPFLAPHTRGARPGSQAHKPSLWMTKGSSPLSLGSQDPASPEQAELLPWAARSQTRFQSPRSTLGEISYFSPSAHSASVRPPAEPRLDFEHTQARPPLARSGPCFWGPSQQRLAGP